MSAAPQYLAYLAYRLAVGLLTRLPVPAVFLLGECLGLGAWLVLPRYRRLALRNLRIAFGDRDGRELARICRLHFQRLGANLLSSVRLAHAPVDELRQAIAMENVAALDGIREAADGRGIVLVISHIGNWEVIAQLAALVPWLRTGTVFQSLRNRFIDAHVRETRSRHGVALFERGDGFDGPLRHLRSGGLVGVLIDQHAGDKGIWTPFFGRLASTSPLAATLALRTGARLLPLAVHTAGRGKWRAVFGDPVEPAGAGAEALTSRLNRTLEDQIRREPADWFWVHNRWKTPKPAFLLEYYRRGVCLPDGATAKSLQPFRIVIRSSNWLGDAIMSMPAVRAIKRGRPDAQVSILCREKLADAWRLVPDVDEVIPLPGRGGVVAAARILRRHGRFDVGVVFPNSFRTALEMWLAGVPRRAGYAGHWRRRLLNQVVPEPGGGMRTRHHAHYYLSMARSFGAAARDPIVPLPARKCAAPGEKLKLGLCPGAEFGPAKRWMPESFAAVVGEVGRRRDCEWVLFGTAGDRAIADQIIGALQPEPEKKIVRDLCGKTSLSELIGELGSCQLLLTNDTGTMHLAALLGVPTVALFGSTEPKWTGPQGNGHKVIRHQVECSPCFLRACPIDFRCFKAIETDEVVEAVMRVLAES